MVIVTLSFSKTALKMFSVHTKPKNGVFIFKKLRFRDGLVWTEDLTGKNKAPFSNSSGLVWTRPIRSYMKSAAFKPGAILCLPFLVLSSPNAYFNTTSKLK